MAGEWGNQSSRAALSFPTIPFQQALGGLALARFQGMSALNHLLIMARWFPQQPGLQAQAAAGTLLGFHRALTKLGTLLPRSKCMRMFTGGLPRMGAETAKKGAMGQFSAWCLLKQPMAKPLHMRLQPPKF